tara:strand:+ start:1108 stop:2355 length:1248 start_codon:yes stop_codon:yes gene_type:complete
MKKTLFPLLIALSALAVSGSAAFYSVFGLSKLFAGASTQVIIMAGSLEFAKLVVASLLYQYWDTINRVLRIYLSIACFVLILITSGGIYGFLSGAYQETATKSEFLDKSLVVLETKQNRFEEQKTDLTLEKTQLNTTISDLRTSLSNPAQVSYYDAEAEKVITTTSSSTRRALQSELKTTIEDRDKLNLKLEAVMDSVMRIDTELLELEIGNEEQRELGPLKYLAETTGYPMGQVVNWFLLLIIFVFDPLAIALVVAANFAFTQIRRKEPEVKMSVPDGLEFNTPYTMEEVSEAFKRQDKKEELEIDEKRMNIIGQNGNDGLHYDNIITTTENLTKDEIENISKEIGKTEKETNPTPINPSKKDLEKLAEVLNINYSDENVDLDRLTDTTQTLINKVVRSENEKNKNTLKYKGRK